MPSIIQNAIYVPETQTYHLAPTEGSVDIPFDGGLVLTIGGGLDCAWREPIETNTKLLSKDRYQEYTLTDEHSVEWMREKLLWPLRNGPDTVAIPIKDMTYDALLDILDGVEGHEAFHRLPVHFREVILYWVDQKEEKHLSGN